MALPYNPYIAGSGPKLQPSLVAFIDILGYREIVRNSIREGSSDKFLRKLYHALEESREYVDPQYADIFRETRKKDFFAFSAFSDNIVIGYPIQHFGKAELIELCRQLSSFQMSLAMAGFFVRGAIALGDFYMDQIAVFGPALIEAVEAEEKLAINPRIVLADSAKMAVDEYLEYYAVKTQAPFISSIWKDADGEYFMNYLNTTVSEDGYLNKQELLKNHKDLIEANLREYCGNASVWSKFIWVARYHNRFCDKCLKTSANLKIDIEDFCGTLGPIVE